MMELKWSFNLQNISNDIIDMLLEEAQILYHSLKRILKQFYNMRVYCVGSMARREKNVDDIDLITADPILGTHMKYVRFKYEGVYVDIWRINDVQFAKCIRSFNKTDSIALRSIAKKRGYKLNDDGLFFGDKRIEVKNKRDLLRILGIHHIK